MEDTKERIYYLDILRLIATFAVIILHLAGTQRYSIDPHSSAWLSFNLWDSMVRWSVPVFVMISGALFLNPEKKITTKKIYSKNIFRIITAFTFWTITYTLYDITLNGNRDVMAIIKELLIGHFHMWFLFMIVGLYVITPLLRRITVELKLTKYFIAIALVFSIIIPSFMDITGVLVQIHDYQTMEYLRDLIFRISGNTDMQFTLHYVTYFVLGYYLSNVI